MLISHTDDHLRNHGYLRRTTSGWELSPAFDINPDPTGGAFETLLDGQDSGRIDSLLRLANHFDLTTEQATVALQQVIAATSQWETVARRFGISKSEISDMAPAFERPAVALAKELVAAA